MDLNDYPGFLTRKVTRLTTCRRQTKGGGQTTAVATEFLLLKNLLCKFKKMMPPDLPFMGT
ncbi:MAG: hypothetical protein KFF73_04870, partial [Cyclobacteriaceae bacterium]|nr:hypothetical protein [Cyclobacteriaceae bacterium]